MERIAVVSHKGGSGKTTVSVNLAGALAAAGHLVLVVDVDPQAAAGAALGVPPEPPTLIEVLAGRAQPADAIRPSSTNRLSVLPASLDLAGAEVALPDSDDWQAALRRVLVRVEGFDYVVVDTAPGLGVLPYLAMMAADRVLAICPPDFLAYRALPSVLEAASQADVKLIGIVPNQIEHRTRHEADVLAELHANHGEQLLSEIPRRVVLRDAAIAGLPVTTYAPSSDAATAFDRLAAEVAPEMVA